ncbi:SMEK domain-containing protein [Serratia marcescens]|uniref:SMEK domain-containing protein n=1 Tax=Serratia marcescens TaxID=615 RepID=UPI0037C88ECE
MQPERMSIAKELRDFAATLAAQIRIHTRNGLNDLAKAQEQSLLPLINKAYARQFIDLNEKKANHPVIDYGEYTAGLGLQMTASVRKDKFKNTIDKLLSNPELRKGYRVIWFFLLTVDAVPASATFYSNAVTVKYITLDDLINQVLRSGIQAQINFLSLAKKEYSSYFKNEFSSFTLSEGVSVPQNLRLFNDFIGTVEWFPENPTEGYSRVHSSLENFRKRLSFCSKEARTILISIVKIAECPVRQDGRVEIYLDQLMGSLNISPENSGNLQYYMEVLENNRLLAFEDEFQEMYESGEDILIKNRRKVILNYGIYDPDINLFTVLPAFYRKYHTHSDFERAIEHLDFSLLSDFKCKEFQKIID